MLLRHWLSRKRFRAYHNDDRIGLCVNLERPLGDKRILSGSEIAAIVDTLHLRRIAIRVPLHDIERLDEYVAFAGHFPDREILVVVLQDRELIEDKAKLEAAFRRIFKRLLRHRGALPDRQRGEPDQVGIHFPARVPRVLRGRLEPEKPGVPGREAAGGRRHRLRADGAPRGPLQSLSVPLRRVCGPVVRGPAGAPENGQFGFDLYAKIDLLARLAGSGGKVSSPGRPSVWITEVNWPLRNTGRHAPSLDDCRVGESEQLVFLVRYFLLALASGSVSACYWHQLVAPGYGLIDNRGGAVRKRPAFHGFATVCRLFNGAEIEGFDQQEELGYYRLTARQDGAEVVALWRLGGVVSIAMPPGKKAIGIEGDALDIRAGQPVPIGESAVYLVDA